MTMQETNLGATPDIEALQRAIHSLDQLVEDCEQSGNRRAARAALRVARDLYEPVRDIAEEIRMAHGDIPAIRVGIAKLDEALS